MAKCSTIRVGLDKPPIGKNTIFYASMNGTIQPEVGELPDWVQSKDIPFREGAYGLQVIGSITYPIKGLNLEEPFTFSYTYNVFEDSFVESWNGICILALKGDSYYKKVIGLMTGNLVADSEVARASLDFLTTAPSMNVSRKLWSARNNYRRVTITSNGTVVECYFDGILTDSFNLSEKPVKSNYTREPEMQLFINWGHNKSSGQKYGISEILVAQEYLPPIGLKAYPLEKKDDIILPKKNYLDALTQCEVKKELTVTLPSTHKVNDKLTNNYVFCSSLNNICQKGLPNVKVKDKSDGLKWSVNDKIIMEGILGENIQATPSIKVEGTETVITGSWEGVGTNLVTFTITSISEENRNKNLVVKYSISRTKLEEPIINKCIDKVVGLRLNNSLILPEKINESEGKGVKFKVNNDVLVEFDPYTLTLKSKIDQPFEILVLFSEVEPKSTNLSSIELLANQNCFITVSALNQKLNSYPKILRYLLNSKDLSKDVKSKISFSANCTSMQINGIKDIISTQSASSVVNSKNTDFNIITEDVNFGNITENNVKPVFIRPLLGKKKDTGELVLVTRLSYTTATGRLFNKDNVLHIADCYIPTGVFEK